MTDRNPFAKLNGFEKTTISLGSGTGQSWSPASGPGYGPTSAGYGPTSGHETTIVNAMTSTGANRLVAAAAPLLTLAARLRTAMAQRDIERLHQRVITELNVFKGRAETIGTMPDQLRAAHYALCATIDDLVKNTPWGGESLWPQRGMLSTFHSDVKGGERFYDLLDYLHKNPGHNGDVLELMYLCLSLGFEGENRVKPNGVSEHARRRDGLYRTITQRRGPFERELSPHWQGVTSVPRPVGSHIPLWVVGLITAALMVAVYVGFSYPLNQQSDGVYDVLAKLPPQKPVIINLPEPPDGGTNNCAVEHDDCSLNHLSSFLQPEIAAGLIEVGRSGNSTLIRTRGPAMFASGSATVNERYMALLNRIAVGLREEPGAITITGYTDNVAIRSLRFPSNWHLSKARAEAVRDIVAPALGDPDRVKAVGGGAGDPIGDNTTAEGRERNRRIEFLLNRGTGGAS